MVTEATGTADLHIHTNHSDGQPTVRELLDHVANHSTLSVIAVTDHDTITGALEARHIARDESYPFEVVVGEEISTRQGHLVGLFLRERIAPGLSARDTVSAIHAQGGLAFAPHPFFRARQTSSDAITMVGLGALTERLEIDAIETINATPFLGPANRRASAFNESLRKPALASSDAHVLAAVGKGYTRFNGRDARDLYLSIVSGQTAAYARPYSAQELLTYLRYWLKMTGGKLPSYLWPDREPVALDGEEERELAEADRR